MTALVSWCFRRAGVVIVLWLLALGGLVTAATHTGAAFRDTVDLPDADSTVAANLLRAFGAGGAGERVVVRAEDGPVDSGTGRARLDALAVRLAAVPHVVSVDPLPGAVSADRRTAVLTVRFDAPAADLGQGTADALAATVRDAEGLTAGVSGELAAMTAAAPDLGNAGIGLLAAAVVLLVAFGSLTCVALPVLTAAVSVGCALAAVTLVSHVMTVPKISTEIAALLGLGVGVDYALFVLTRYRQGRRDGAGPAAALAVAAATSGRSVVFAGVTVCVSLAGMLTVGLPFLDGIAAAAAVSVLLTAFAALTLLPALLRLLGRRMSLRPDGDGVRWARLARSVTARPGPYTLAAVLVVAVLALPTTGLRLGVPDAALDPPGSVTRTAAELLEEGFGPGADAALLVVGTGGESVGALREALLASADVGPPTALPGGTWLLTVLPRTGPGDPATGELLASTRVMARVVGSPDAHVGGVVAARADFAKAITARLPLFLAAVVGISVLLLAWVFRSVLIPLTAAVMNLLTAAATTGAVVFAFGGPIEPYLPVFLFAGLFGLSMDYEVFLIARIQEAWRRHGDTRAAVVDGVTATGRTITAAALIMALVFVSFAFVDARVVREAGVGLTVAVLLDAVVVRCVLVPAVMARLGAANWWFPHRKAVVTGDLVGSAR
ncbi:integral membrane export protein [Amycolatopsis mediterranei S699]|uniref:Integral membrane export protein n=3 Tax=Amycolatopsis mediterranei TaxID=33910 RepID=A0A9R0U8T7_AMYMS|nr:MMPL family transporter [Amycolatopsis mediterranei]ADJ45151.1 putative integral membrane export protein [Amycolatopsis mediterranei U32]AEK41910.1 integral membrane export protein [Amycolatopsis mediterranei S699]AFO76862.1 integral membrane export protein [Amycolatopsis mediterranei S699]AGT83990.1 integral membrane export protein [Amycolatopsis mediterranei RB]KDO08625.1 membrane protein [Amycolatopsis mediterranei]